MRFGLSESMVKAFPDMCVGLVVLSDFENRPSSEAEVRLLRDAAEHAKARLGAMDLRDFSNIAVWRRRFEATGMNPNKFRISVEALLSRVVKGEQIPPINALVDLVNVISLKYLLPAGAHDIGQDRGDIEVRHARPSESFQPMGCGEAEVVPEGEIVYADEMGVRTRRWVWRQSDLSKVHLGTKSAIIPIDGFLGQTDGDVRAAVEELVGLLRERFGVEASSYFLCSEAPSVGLGCEDESASSPAAICADHPATCTFDAIQELLERNVVDVISRVELEKRLRSGEKLRVKFGIDPTGPRIHIGRAVPLRKLKQFQDLGHQLVIIIGDFTAQIGDASDKSAARQMLTAEEVQANLETYIEQMGKILDTSKLEIHHNSDWLGKLGFKDIIQLASQFTVAQMLERDNFTERFSQNKPIGLHEFMYPLMQGYDSVVIKADVELGGTDQLFNLMAGRELQKAFGQRPQDIMLTQLIPGVDGRKMSTSWGNTITISDEPSAQFGKLMSVSDDLIVPYLLACTEVPMAEVREMESAMLAGENPIHAKKRLAALVCTLYHGKDAAGEALAGFERTVQNKEIPEDMPTYSLVGDASIVDLLVNSGLVPSRSEARRLVEQGGVSLDGERVGDPRAAVVLVSTEVVLKAGKRKYLRLVRG